MAQYAWHSSQRSVLIADREESLTKFQIHVYERLMAGTRAARFLPDCMLISAGRLMARWNRWISCPSLSGATGGAPCART